MAELPKDGPLVCLAFFLSMKGLFMFEEFILKAGKVRQKYLCKIPKDKMKYGSFSLTLADCNPKDGRI
jgi:hypothetical protein